MVFVCVPVLDKALPKLVFGDRARGSTRKRHDKQK